MFPNHSYKARAELKARIYEVWMILVDRKGVHGIRIKRKEKIKERIHR